MTLSEILKVVSTELEIPVSEIMSKGKMGGSVMGRHIFRTISKQEFHFSEMDIGKFEVVQRGLQPSISTGRSAVYHSVSIIERGDFRHEYDRCLRKIRTLFPPSPVEVNERRMEEQIIRVTQEAFDERFYQYNKRINKMSGNNWYPSWHFLWGMGAPPEKFLIEYHKSKGYYSDIDFYRAEVMGSYVHHRIEDMGKYNIDTTKSQIYRAFPNPKEARRVEESMQAFINFMNTEEPEVIAWEQMMIADDWGGTVDMRARIKSDNYKSTWTIDFKTSKAVYTSHKAQVESYRRTLGDDRCAVLILGNTTAKRYTFSEVKNKERNDVYKDFENIKATAYHRLQMANRLKPHKKDMPDVFSLKNVKYKNL